MSLFVPLLLYHCFLALMLSAAKRESNGQRPTKRIDCHSTKSTKNRNIVQQYSSLRYSEYHGTLQNYFVFHDW